MAEVQTQWVKEDGKWCQKAVKVPPVLPSRPVQSTKAPTLPPRSTRLSNDQTTPRPLIKAAPIPRRPSDEDSSPQSRRTSTALSRRTSNDSMNSAATAETSLSTLSNGTSIKSASDRFTIRAPEYDPSSLPALPPRKTKEEKDAEVKTSRYALKSTKSATNVPRVGEPIRPSPPARPQTKGPPPLPSRGNLPDETLPTADEVAPPAVVRQAPRVPVLPSRPQHSEAPQLPVRGTAQRQEAPRPVPQRAIIPPPAKRSALTLGFGGGDAAATKPAVPGPRLSISALDSTPPPIPTASRPDLSALQASKPKMNGSPASTAPAAGGCCMECRDFSGPDNHAARFPRESLPSHDLGWLAQSLTGQFASETDKARAIFTWLHHNIAYDTVAFFGNNVKPSTPGSTLATGLAVCEGYAGLFTALAVKAGLQSVVVGGHGKGFGYAPHIPGNPLPKYDAGHAWNAVKIDGGEWKLIDPCWGAGSVCDKRADAYQKKFTPEWFTMDNNTFGLRHYPEDPALQYRTDGRTMGWEEYCTCDKDALPQFMVCAGYVAEEGISQYSMRPNVNPIPLAAQGPTVRFSFQTTCQHQGDLKRKQGGYYLYVLHMDGVQDKLSNDVAFNKGDGIWWCDVPTKNLGPSGGSVWIYAVKDFCGKDGRGLTADMWMSKRRSGNYSYQFGGVAQYMLA